MKGALACSMQLGHKQYVQEVNNTPFEVDGSVSWVAAGCFFQILIMRQDLRTNPIYENVFCFDFWVVWKDLCIYELIEKTWRKENIDILTSKMIFAIFFSILFSLIQKWSIENGEHNPKLAQWKKNLCHSWESMWSVCDIHLLLLMNFILSRILFTASKSD